MCEVEENFFFSYFIVFLREYLNLYNQNDQSFIIFFFFLSFYFIGKIFLILNYSFLEEYLHRIILQLYCILC